MNHSNVLYFVKLAPPTYSLLSKLSHKLLVDYALSSLQLGEIENGLIQSIFILSVAFYVGLYILEDRQGDKFSVR
jgi:hypothetical protein